MGSVTRSHPTDDSGSGGGGGSSDPAWYEEYSFDFTTQASGSITHNDTIDLGTRAADGATVTWTAEEDATNDVDDALGTLEWVSGSGLRVTPATGVATNTHSSIDTPCLTVALSDCIPNLTNRDAICVQVFLDEPVTMAANHDGYGVILYKPEPTLGAVTEWLQYRTYFDWNNRLWQVSGDAAAKSVQSSAILPTPSSLEIVLYSTGGIGVCAHSTSTDVTASPLQTIADDRAIVQFGGGTPPNSGAWAESWVDPATLRLALVCFKESGSGTAFYTDFSSVRILRLGGHAGGAL
jgi:hypothetical protein